MLVWPRRWVRHPARVVEMRKRVRSVRRVGASGGGRVVPASGDDCHTPAPGPRDPSTNHVAPCPARTRRTGYPRRPGRSGSDCCDTPSHRRGRSSTLACASSTCSAAAMAVSMIVVVSPTSAPCSVTATIAPVSMSTACSALCARCVRPSFIFVTFASGSWGFVRCSRSSSSASDEPSRVGVSIPEAFARPARNAW